MKYIIFILMLPMAVMGQVLPDGCVKHVNVPAEYSTDYEYIDVPAVTYVKPVVSRIAKDVVVKEKAIENYFECAIDGTLKQCSRTIPEVKEVVTYEVVTGFETIVLIPQSVKKIEKKVKVRDGYVALVPCDKIIINK